MPVAKIAITLDEKLLCRLDAFVASARFPSRSRAVQAALKDKLDRLDHTRLARECAKLNAAEESAQADEGLERDMEQWPEY